jgi:hypothetical protein
MTELERVKEFMETLEFHGYIDHDPTKLDQLIQDYYPLNQEQTLPMDNVMLSAYFIIADNEPTIVMAENMGDACDKIEKLGVIEYEFVHARSIDIMY